MKQYEQVIAALEENGGYATLGQLYQLIDFSSWGTNTPHASVRRIVQNRAEIFKIKPGLWALEDFREKLPPQILSTTYTNARQVEEYDHSYYQGLLVELGNMRQFQTFVPAQDKNRLFLKHLLGSIANITTCPPFTYAPVLDRAKTIDVIWFNGRGFPHAVYEVEHSTDFQNSLLKYVELQDFRTKFFIVADSSRKGLYDKKVSQSAFEPIRERTEFLDYEKLSNWHQRQFELNTIGY